MTRLAYVTTYDARPSASPTTLLGVQGAGRSIASELVARGIGVDFVGPLATKVSRVLSAGACQTAGATFAAAVMVAKASL